MENQSHLYILWAGGDPVTAEKMVFMYSMNALRNGWWQQVTIVVWGASATLVPKDEAIQRLIQSAGDLGVRFTACKACADQLGVTGRLEALGIQVDYLGTFLTDLLKSKAPLITV